MASNTELTIVVVDDEQLARDELCFMLERLAGVNILGRAGNGYEAVSLIERVQPDLVFLDVQMPGLTGFEVARRVHERKTSPQVIFVTAYDRYAIEAFEVDAVDYLLKPVDPTRLAEAVDRAKRRVTSERPLSDRLERIVQLVAAHQHRREQLAIKVGERFLLVRTDDIIYASLMDDSINIVTSQAAGTSNFRTLDELHTRLDPSVFWRVHRSHLVNINKIKEIVPWFSRNYILRMKDAKATEIPVSRTQTKRLREYLKL
jgi:two-component system LytT family response regulator/two-component system response regulator LytT